MPAFLPCRSAWHSFTGLSLILALAAPVAAQEIPDNNDASSFALSRRVGVLTLYAENDSFGGTDQNYTSGVKISWLSEDLSSWELTGLRQNVAEALPFVNQPHTQKNFGLSIGQNIYSPQDTISPVPDPTDRPYAGWSYLELSFVSKNEDRVDIFSVQAGIVGPSSLAKNTQRAIHRLINEDSPKGWSYQLRDEPGLNFIYERRLRFYARNFSDVLGFDFIPHGGVSVGNVQTHANLGATARFGYHLPSDFGVALARGGSVGAAPVNDLDPRVALNRNISVFLFLATDGRAVARDIFLDGNTWRDGPSVDKRILVADVMGGIGAIAGRWQLTGTFVHRTREFSTQPDAFTRFGSITLSVAL